MFLRVVSPNLNVDLGLLGGGLARARLRVGLARAGPRAPAWVTRAPPRTVFSPCSVSGEGRGEDSGCLPSEAGSHCASGTRSEESCVRTAEGARLPSRGLEGLSVPSLSECGRRVRQAASGQPTARAGLRQGSTAAGAPSGRP